MQYRRTLEGKFIARLERLILNHAINQVHANNSVKKPYVEIQLSLEPAVTSQNVADTTQEDTHIHQPRTQAIPPFFQIPNNRHITGYAALQARLPPLFPSFISPSRPLFHLPHFQKLTTSTPPSPNSNQPSPPYSTPAPWSAP